MEKVTVYAEKYVICTLLGNMLIMLRSHIRIKPAWRVNLTGIIDAKGQKNNSVNCHFVAGDEFVLMSAGSDERNYSDWL